MVDNSFIQRVHGGDSSLVASAVADQTTLVLSPTRQHDDRNGKRRKETELSEDTNGDSHRLAKNPLLAGLQLVQLALERQVDLTQVLALCKWHLLQ